MSIKAVFGENLKYYRKKKNLSQEQLSEKLETSPKHLGQIERGVDFVSANMLEKITQILGISASALFYSTKEKSSDDSMLNSIDQIIEKELIKTSESIKLQIRHIDNS